ncbi:DNA repair protein RecO [Acaryochloris sp. IP29b_bin.148]|uniref:DNA repair protein RecO n=1 Tax=Acaryochloris sp. IP29b_bin.148 TaxID=2969218 RepID=UPI00262D1DF2|nr:DNA repair protein RecO [Acaryochloris sp. IP29b_bin.148]
MSRTYKATGINLKSMPFGEADRLLTILTREQGLVRAVAPGCRKPKSKLGGRSALFVVNDLMLVQGRSLDKIAQAETLESYPGLSQNLAKLTTSQYLAELTLYQALSGQPQTELWDLFCQQLTQLQTATPAQIPCCLIHGTLQLLAWAGIAPQVHTCCLTHKPLAPPITNPTWRVGFSASAGGAVTLTGPPRPSTAIQKAAEQGSIYAVATEHRVQGKLSAQELALLQDLNPADIQPTSPLPFSLVTAYPLAIWQGVESALRRYAEAYFERPIRSAALIDTCFTALPDLTSVSS